MKPRVFSGVASSSGKGILTGALIVAFFLIAAQGMAQQLIQIGPFGEPIMVMDPAGNWSIPIKVYTDKNLDVFIPNLTDPGWVSWNKDEFIKSGRYETYTYLHWKNGSHCQVEFRNDPARLSVCSKMPYNRHLVSVDTRNKTITYLETIWMDRNAAYNPELQWRYRHVGSLTDAKSVAQTMNRVTAIIEKEVREAANEPSAQDIGRRNDIIAGCMAENSMHPRGQCGLTCCEHRRGLVLPNKTWDSCKEQCPR